MMSSLGEAEERRPSAIHAIAGKIKEETLKKMHTWNTPCPWCSGKSSGSNPRLIKRLNEMTMQVWENWSSLVKGKTSRDRREICDEVLK